MIGLVATICGVFGLLVGSFLNVVIWRVPRRESIVAPAVALPGCDAAIAPYDNIPVVSWLVLRGRCRHCGTSISARYPPSSCSLPCCSPRWARASTTRGRCPRTSCSRPGSSRSRSSTSSTSCCRTASSTRSGSSSIPLLLVGSVLEDDLGAFGRALLGGAVAFAVFFVIHVVSPRGMGFGDVRLSFLLGCFLGWLGWWHLGFGLFAGFLYGAVVGVAAHGARQAGSPAAHPVRAVPRRRRDDDHPLRRSRSIDWYRRRLNADRSLERHFRSNRASPRSRRGSTPRDPLSIADIRLVRRLTIVGKGSCRDVCGTEVKGWSHDHRLLTVREVADDVRVSTMTVYRLIKSGALPAIRVGKHFRIREVDLSRYLDAQTTVPGGGRMARRLIGLDIGTNAVTIAEVSPGSPPRLERFGQVALPRDAMREGEVARRRARVTDAIARLRRRSASRRRRSGSVSRARASSCARSRCR